MLHASAAFLASGSSHSSQSLVENMLRSPPVHLLTSMKLLPSLQLQQPVQIGSVWRRWMSPYVRGHFCMPLMMHCTSACSPLLPQLIHVLYPCLVGYHSHAGDWLNVVLSPSLGLHLQDKAFRCCLRYWLGLPLHSSYSCPECGGIADVHGDHQVGCGRNGENLLPQCCPGCPVQCCSVGCPGSYQRGPQLSSQLQLQARGHSTPHLETWPPTSTSSLHFSN